MGLVTGTFGIGQVVSGLVSGVIVDRVDRRRLMILCDLLRLVLYGSIPLVWLLAGRNSGWSMSSSASAPCWE